MSKIKLYIQTLLKGLNISVPEKREMLLENFINDEENSLAVKQILNNQQMLKNKWLLQNRIADIIDHQVFIPNGTVGKVYEAQIDFIKLGWNDIVFTDFGGLEETGLNYNNDKECISGTPIKSGDIRIVLKFRIEGEAEDSILNEKKIAIIINPDPKSLWKDIESDCNDPYWKEDNIAVFDKLGDKNIVVASKRGRSHANVGSFRDDDFSFKHFEKTGWSVIAVADGAGSSKLARKAADIACKSIIEFGEKHFDEENTSNFDQIIHDFKAGLGEESQKKLSHFVYNSLSKAAYTAHQSILDFSNFAEVGLKDCYSTLIFTFIKKYDFGYAILSFGVGDCPIAILNKDQTEVTLLNWLDVGEFGGGTRFITMPEIFTSDKFSSRFKFKLVEDFSYLFLMTDGIYDPKFIVEANLEKLQNWNEFIEDLKGNNEDKIGVDFKPDNLEIANQLSKWMDFWSPGNHDDRTLAILY